MSERIVVCEICGKEFLANHWKRKICFDPECTRLRTLKYMSGYVDAKNKNKPNSIACKICGMSCNRQISPGHLRAKHNLSLEEYKLQFKLKTEDLFCEEILKDYSDKVKGDKNPAFNHGGKFSPFSKNFINYDEEKMKATREKATQTKRNNPQKENTKIEYYLLRGFSEEEAKEKLTERQTTFTLRNCIKKYGDIEGLKQWQTRQDKWQANLKSKSDDEIKRINKAKMFTKGRTISNKEKEIVNYLLDKGYEVEQQFSIKTSLRTWWIYDIKIGNKIIEFNGDYFHCNPKKYNEDFYNKTLKMTAKEKWRRDKLKIEEAVKNGFTVYEIWESDYKDNKELELQKCLEFINHE
jgi:hypothetical protein